MKKFQRNKEDFICEKCGLEVKGSGFTNHCPNCLWSKHVDVNPGDRRANCGGMMEPFEAELKSKEYSIWHKCLKCGFKKKNKVSKGDNLDILADLN
jgi:Zn finger protein HypA/HybF involved in hydrogenase expression